MAIDAAESLNQQCQQLGAHSRPYPLRETPDLAGPIGLTSVPWLRLLLIGRRYDNLIEAIIQG